MGSNSFLRNKVTIKMQKNSTISASKNIVIDVVSDFACPWCYVGFMRLQNAIDKLKKIEVNEEKNNFNVEVRWHSYQIDPRTKPNGESYMDYNRRRWGRIGENKIQTPFGQTLSMPIG